MIIRDTLRDKRFRDNPLVTDGPMFRAYLGCPMTISGLVIGTLCVLYRHPQEFSKENVVDVKELVRIIEDLIACRRA